MVIDMFERRSVFSDLGGPKYDMDVIGRQISNHLDFSKLNNSGAGKPIICIIVQNAQTKRYARVAGAT